MPADNARRLRGAVLAATMALLVTACTPTPGQSASPSASPTPRDFTVATAEPVTTADPAATTTDSDAILAVNTYQRLMRVVPVTGDLKPDAATDCIFASRTVYECTLPEGLTFHNGHLLTASDVKFSIERALRLDVDGASISMLGALDRIESPNPTTIRFHLDWADNQFGYALAGPAASIVDEQVYDADTVLDRAALPVGSGPYQVEAWDDQGVTFVLNKSYLGPLVGDLPRIRLVRVSDSVAGETAIAKGSADMVWRTLDEPALGRLTAEIAANPDQTTAQGFTRLAMPGMRTTLLVWNPASRLRRNATLRLGVARALQRDRTLDSIVPAGVPGHLAAFPVGGRPKLPQLKGDRIIMTLGYLPSAPGHADLARLLRDRIEALGGISVRLVTGADADLVLTDRGAWVNNAFGWLQRYLDDPLPGSAAKLDTLERRARTTSEDARTVALGELQKQASVDGTVLPVSQADGIAMVGRGVILIGEPFASGWQLGLWGIRRG